MKKLKGHTVIELKDVVTGKVEKIEKDNLVTNAVQEFLSLWQPLLGWGAISEYFTPLYKNMFGGLYLFDTALVESASNTFLPNAATSKLTGYAGQATTDGNDPKRGSFNFNESEALVNGYKFVWDFATSEANGTIAALALTNPLAGFHGYTYDPLAVFSNPAIYTGNDFGNYKGMGWSNIQNSDGISTRNYWRLAFMNPDLSDKYRPNCEFSATPNEIKWKNFYQDYGSNWKTFVNVHDVKTNNLDILGDYGKRKIVETEATNNNAPITGKQMAIDTGTEILLLAPSDNTFYVSVYNRTSYALVDSFSVDVYSAIGKRCASSMWNNAPYYGCGVAYRNGYVYFIVRDTEDTYNKGYVAKLNISTKSVTLVTPKYTLSQGSQTNTIKALVYKDVNGNIYAGGYLIDNNDDYIEIGLTNNYQSYGWYGFVSNYAYLFNFSDPSDGGICPNLQYLATINNLSSPVTKTASKTMKVTYTLTESV